ncbi:MAG: HmuY family protein [Prevotella sp.]
MNRRKTMITMLGTVFAAGLFSACDALEGIYDNDRAGISQEEQQQYYDGVVKSGSFYADATSYTQWVYINLHSDSLTMTTSTISLEDYSEDGAPEEWDFALHRYDVKTNVGSVMLTEYNSVEELESNMTETPAEGWNEDEYSDESVTIDMSHMLEGYLVYAPGYKNKTAGLWLDVDTSTMPPNYSMSDKVFLYKFSDGTCAAIQLKNYMSNDRYQTKGWMTVAYKYPMFVKIKDGGAQ